MPLAPQRIKAPVLKTRPTYRQRYGKDWPKIRRVWLAKNPFCEGCGSFSEQIHHKDHNRQNNDEANFAAICRSCHSKLHAVEGR